MKAVSAMSLRHREFLRALFTSSGLVAKVSHVARISKFCLELSFA